MKDYKLLIAVLIVAIVWGTTFLGIRIAVETIPGWFVAGIRQFIAGIIMLIILIFRKELKWIGWRNLFYQIIIATLMLIFANGMTTVAEENLTSSLASLISASTPILVFIGSIIIGLQKFTLKGLIGVLMCVCGILFIFWDGLEDLANPAYRSGIILMFCAICGFASGTLFSKKIKLNTDNITLNLFYQFLFAGIFQIGLAFIFSDNYNFENWSIKSLTSVLYLALFGSVVTFYAFHYALSKISPIQVSILSYINTIIAIFLGWLLLDEQITIKFILAACLIITGVFITNYKPKYFSKKRILS
ncbi:MAG: EamA family transporter [Flavobacteriaceae bacterium]|nr:EamA family transporter [Candidatus Onthonaster equi]